MLTTENVNRYYFPQIINGFVWNHSPLQNLIGFPLQLRLRYLKSHHGWKANFKVYHCQSQIHSLTRSLFCLMVSHRNLATLGMDGMLKKLPLMLFTNCGFFLTQKTKTRSRMRTASVTPTAIPTGVDTARKEAHLYKKHTL